MKFGGVGPRKFILQTFVTFAIVSLIYNLFISLQRFPLFSPLPCMVPPSTCFEQFAALYEIIQQAFQMQTIFGLLLGAAISIVLILIIIQHQKQPHAPVSHYLIIGAIVGGDIGSFLAPIPARWQFLQLTTQILSVSHIECDPGCNLVNFHFLALHSNYLIILGIPLIIALLLSLRRRTTRFQSNISPKT